VRSKSLSRRNHASFMRDCFVNAREIEAYWRDGKDLTPRRIEVLRTMYRNAAIAALTNGWPEFEYARQFHNAIASRDFTIESGWILRRAVGVKAASTLARAELKRRAAFRGESPPGS
jgi:hypothetical protein